MRGRGATESWRKYIIHDFARRGYCCRERACVCFLTCTEWRKICVWIWRKKKGKKLKRKKNVRPGHPVVARRRLDPNTRFRKFIIPLCQKDKKKKKKNFSKAARRSRGFGLESVTAASSFLIVLALVLSYRVHAVYIIYKNIIFFCLVSISWMNSVVEVCNFVFFL